MALAATETSAWRRGIECLRHRRYRTRLLAAYAVAAHRPEHCRKCRYGCEFEVWACGDHFHCGHGLPRRYGEGQ